MISIMGTAQEYIELHVDNDLYFKTDWYYSSGIYISTGKQKAKASKKQFIHWTLGQEIYNPKMRYSKDESTFDYPFGGWFFLERKLQTYIDSVSAIEWSVKFGVTGKASFAPYIQNLYHIKVLGLPELSWEKAMPQSTHLNINFDYRKRFYITNQIMKPVQQVFALVLEDIDAFKRKKKNFQMKVDTLRHTIDDKEKMESKISDLRNKEVKALLFDKYLRETDNMKNNMKSITSFFA